MKPAPPARQVWAAAVFLARPESILKAGSALIALPERYRRRAGPTVKRALPRRKSSRAAVPQLPRLIPPVAAPTCQATAICHRQLCARKRARRVHTRPLFPQGSQGSQALTAAAVFHVQLGSILETESARLAHPGRFRCRAERPAKRAPERPRVLMAAAASLALLGNILATESASLVHPDRYHYRTERPAKRAPGEGRVLMAAAASLAVQDSILRTECALHAQWAR